VKGDFKIEAPDHANPGFFVTADAKGGTGEFWTDVSLLHSPSEDLAGIFEFSWLFSSAGGAEPAAGVVPAALHKMVEAQARIISISPPIPIVEH
jgi:hypothetical protein